MKKINKPETVKERTVALNMFQRATLSRILPRDTNWTEFSIKRGINQKLEMSEDELKKIGMSLGDDIKPSDIAILSKKTVKNITFSTMEDHMITKELTALEKGSKLTDQSGPLYELFCK